MPTGTFEYRKYNSMRAGTFQYCMMMVTLGGGFDERIERHVSVTGEVSIWCLPPIHINIFGKMDMRRETRSEFHLTW